MRESDSLVLEGLEEMYFSLDGILKRLERNRSVHVIKLEQVLQELRSQRRTLEELSYPARLIVEQLLEIQIKGGLVAMESEHFSQPWMHVRQIKVEEFGLVKIWLGNLEISWRDGGYTYYFYPDKVELRSADEKSSIKLFFSLAFSQQIVEGFSEFLSSPNVVYIHPKLEKLLKKVD